ncbi:MAG: hypothetical protein M3N32_07950 [Actinomycetota bacterium]|nr:hypothetical protein [Actinomycetota bacterium]
MAVAPHLVPRPCEVDGCPRLRWESSLCASHAPRLRLVQPAVCDVAGCDRPHSAKGFCKSHYKTWWRHMNLEGVDADEARRRLHARANLDRSARIADARLWLEQVWSTAMLQFEEGVA